MPFVLTWTPSNEPLPEPVDAEQALADTVDYWEEWIGRYAARGRWDEPVRRSLLTLKALTYAPTGGIVAAPTTSLPEALGGVRNWDYRYCWLRDATLTLLAFLRAGYTEEARAWRDWLLRAIAGSPEDIQVMYGVAGERRLIELELPWLAGYEGSQPVRIGNDAAGQLQLDVYGEIVDALHLARRRGLEASDPAWALTRKIFEWLESGWREPDQGIWEVRGPRRHFTHSKVMAWVAFDRAVKAVEKLGREGPLDRWRATRDAIREDVLENGYNTDLGAFVQYYGSDRLDASLLLIPLVGFLPADDERVLGTVAAIQRDLMRDGFVERYRADEENIDVDGLPPGEGVFLPCSFWLAAVLAQQGRHDEAVELYERLLSLRNDLGLISEEYDPERKRLVGNFPQAFTHLALVETAFTLRRLDDSAPESASTDIPVPSAISSSMTRGCISLRVSGWTPGYQPALVRSTAVWRKRQRTAGSRQPVRESAPSATLAGRGVRDRLGAHGELAAAEGVRPRERLPDRVAFGDRAGERAERLDPGDEDVAVLPDPLVAAVGEDERLGAHCRAVLLVDRRRHDQVDLSVLVLEEHEDDSVRGRRALAGDGHARDRDLQPVSRLQEVSARERPVREMRAKERERMRPDREPGVAVVREHAFPARQVAKRGRGGGRVERERELLRLPAGPRHRLRPEDEPELPQELTARLPEAVAGTALDECLEPVAREPAAPREVGDVAERPVRVALGDERLGVVLPHRGDVVETDATAPP